MKIASYLLGIGLAGSLVACSRAPETATPKPEEQAAAPTVPVKPKPRTSEPTIRPVETVAPPSVDNAEQIPLRLSAIMQDGKGGTSAGLIDKRSGQGVSARRGEVFQGYRLERIDAENRLVVLSKDGRDTVLRVSGAGGDEAANLPTLPTLPTENLPAAAPTAPTAPSMPDFNNLPPPPKFEPTPEEVQAGIDPNDPQTWPADYRGPGIERAMRAQKVQEQTPGGTTP